MLSLKYKVFREQLPRLPYSVCYAHRHRRGHPQATMNPSKIVVGRVKGDGILQASNSPCLPF